jgi:bifunctional non-homologous end joining protein LigD
VDEVLCGTDLHLEGDGPIIFEHACKMGLEGIVSKRRDLPYRSGRVRSWD